MELWRNIKGYARLYRVSDRGNVYSLKTKKNLHLNKTTAGYMQVTLCKMFSKKSALVHRLVAEAFLDNPKNLPMVNHKDSNPANNYFRNLEWCDQKHNVNHYIKAGRRDRKGERAGMAKLKNENIPIIREMYKHGKTRKEIGLRFNVNPTTIYDVIMNKTWKHI